MLSFVIILVPNASFRYKRKAENCSWGRGCFVMTPLVKKCMPVKCPYNSEVLNINLTFPALCISDSYVKININLNFYFGNSLWCLKRFYEGLYEGL